MTTLVKWSTFSAATSMLTTELNSLASAAISAQSSEYANATSGNRYTHATFQLLVEFVSAPTSGKTVDLYILPAIDGSTYPEGGTGVSPSGTHYAGSFIVRNSDADQYLVLTNVPLPPTDFKVLLVNNAGQNMESSGNVLSMIVYGYEIVTS